MPKKSRGQKRQAKTKQRQQRQARRSSPPSLSFLGGMPFSGAPNVPQGFRPMSMTQALMEYAAPIMAYVEDGTVQDPNDALQVGLLLWNSTLPEAAVGLGIGTLLSEGICLVENLYDPPLLGERR